MDVALMILGGVLLIPAAMCLVAQLLSAAFAILSGWGDPWIHWVGLGVITTGGLLSLSTGMGFTWL